MLRLYIKELLEKLGRKPTAMFISQFDINYRTAEKLLNGKAKTIKIETIYKLCAVLRCTPNDLFDIKPEAEQELGAKHPLLELKKQPISQSAIDLLSTFSPKDLDNIGRLIQDYKNGKEE